MADLCCDWLGLRLANPIVVGASPLCDTVEGAVALVEAGAGAVVVHSLFEEQLIADQVAANRYLDSMIDTNAEARSFLPATEVFSGGATAAMEHLTRLVDALDVPVLASLNGATPGGWTGYARQLSAAGAAAIELNLYDVVTDPDLTGEVIEATQLQVVSDVVDAVDVPVSVKLSPFYTSVPNFVTRLASAGAAGVVLFNRFYQPDLDLETLDIDRHLVLVHTCRAAAAPARPGDPARPRPARPGRQRRGPQRDRRRQGHPLGGRCGAGRRHPAPQRTGRPGSPPGRAGGLDG